jgi:hypothetical protein
MIPASSGYDEEYAVSKLAIVMAMAMVMVDASLPGQPTVEGSIGAKYTPTKMPLKYDEDFTKSTPYHDYTSGWLIVHCSLWREKKAHRYTHGAHCLQLVILVDSGITAKVPLNLRQGEATIGKAHVVNDDLGLLKEGHLNHVLDG